MLTKDEKGYNVQGFLAGVQRRSRRQPGTINVDRPPGTPPPPSVRAETETTQKNTGIPVKHEDGTIEHVDPEVFRRKTLRTAREGGELSESAKVAIKNKHPVTTKPIQQIRMIGDHKVRVITRRSQLGQNRRRSKDSRFNRLRDNSGGIDARKKLYQKMGFVPAETGRSGGIPSKKE